MVGKATMNRAGDDDDDEPPPDDDEEDALCLCELRDPAGGPPTHLGDCSDCDAACAALAGGGGGCCGGSI